MFGHGRVQNVAALVAAVISISFMSLETFRKAVQKLSQPLGFSEFQGVSLALAVISISMFVVAIPTMYILRTKARGAAVRTQLIMLLRDEASLVVGLMAVIFIAHGYYLADPLASTFVAAVILISGLHLLKDNACYLMGRAPLSSLWRN